MAVLGFLEMTGGTLYADGLVAEQFNDAWDVRNGTNLVTLLIQFSIPSLLRGQAVHLIVIRQRS